MTEPERLSPALEDLLKAERPLAGPPQATAQSIFKRIAVEVALPVASPPIVAKLHWPWLIGSAVVAVVGVGRALQKPPAPPPPVVQSEVPATRFERTILAERTPVLPALPVAAAPELSAPPVAPPSTKLTIEEELLARERALLETAHSAWQRGDNSAALATLNHHAADFPSGQLTEEREALTIRVLARLERLREASTRAKAFIQRYPNSALRSSIEPYLEVE